MANYITNFINLDFNDPALVINPDSIQDREQEFLYFSNYSIQLIQLQTLNGKKHKVRATAFNDNSERIGIRLNGIRHNILKSTDTSLWSFDADIVLPTREQIKYYIFYDKENDTLTEWLQDSDTVNLDGSGGKISIYHLLGVDSNLSTAFNHLGFSVDYTNNLDVFSDALNISRKLEFKFRIKNGLKNYFTYLYKNNTVDMSASSSFFAGNNQHINNIDPDDNWGTWQDKIYP